MASLEFFDWRFNYNIFNNTQIYSKFKTLQYEKFDRLDLVLVLTGIMLFKLDKRRYYRKRKIIGSRQSRLVREFWNGILKGVAHVRVF